MGTSIPTVPFPGTGATILIFGAFIASARSSASPAIFDTFIPGPGSNSYLVITGPVPMDVIFPVMPKSLSFSTSFFAFNFNSDSAMPGSEGSGSLSRLRNFCLNSSLISTFIISSPDFITGSE